MAAAAATHTSTDIVLTSADGTQFTVPREIAVQSVTVKNLLEDVSDTAVPIPLPNVDTSTLRDVVAYLGHFHEHPRPAREGEQTRVGPDTVELTPWEREIFDQMETARLFLFILASNYLDVKDMLDASCYSVAGKIKGKSTEEIRALFNIKNDFTPEEEEQVRKENEWCENP